MDYLKKYMPVMYVFEELTPEEIDLVIPSLEMKDFNMEQIIFKEGEYGQGIYFILEGYVDIMKTTSTGEYKKISTIYPLGTFGEMALMGLIEGSKRSATAIASTSLKVIILSRANFDKLMRKDPIVGIKMLRRLICIISSNIRKLDSLYVSSVNKPKESPKKYTTRNLNVENSIHLIPFFAGLDKDKLEKVIKPFLQLKEFQNEQVIFNEGEFANAMYFLLEGQVDVIKKSEAGNQKKIATIYPFSTFGEMAIVDYNLRSATVKASSYVKAFALSSENFDNLISTDAVFAINILKCIARIISGILRKTTDNYIELVYNLNS